MGVLRVGQKVTVPELDGEWAVWSPAGGHGPGAYFVVPASGGGWAVIRAKQGRAEAHPTITLIQPPGGTR